MVSSMSYSHRVEINEEKKCISIYRIYENGARKELYTHMDLPDISFEKDKNKFYDFARLLGENLLVDSLVARKLFGLE